MLTIQSVQPLCLVYLPLQLYIFVILLVIFTIIMTPLIFEARFAHVSSRIFVHNVQFLQTVIAKESISHFSVYYIFSIKIIFLKLVSLSFSRAFLYIVSKRSRYASASLLSTSLASSKHDSHAISRLEFDHITPVHSLLQRSQMKVGIHYTSPRDFILYFIRQR
jgi:hypothetical protein